MPEMQTVRGDDSRRPRALLIGAGRMGAQHYRSIVASTLFDTDISVVDPSSPARAHYADVGASVFANLDEVDLTRVDFAVVAAPTAAHMAIASQLAGSNVACLLEKPCALSDARFSELLALETLASTQFAVGFWRRFSVPFLRVRDLLYQGEIGAPRAVMACQWDGSIPDLSTQPVSVTGGIGLDCGIHETDTIEWLGLGRVRDLTSATPGDSDPRVAAGDHDQMLALGVTDMSIPVTIALSRTAGAEDEIFYKIIGSSGSIEMRLGIGAEVRIRTVAETRQEVHSTSWFADGLIAQIVAASSAVERQGLPRVSHAANAARPWLRLRQV